MWAVFWLRWRLRRVVGGFVRVVMRHRFRDWGRASMYRWRCIRLCCPHQSGRRRGPRSLASVTSLDGVLHAISGCHVIVC
jgi:hypothetical protein